MNQKLEHIVVGDVHGRYDQLYHIIKVTQAEIVFVCGDFGIWTDKPSMDANIDNLLYRLPNREVKIYWAPGNHEWWDEIERVYGRNGLEPIEMREGSNIFYCPIGSVLNYKDNNILFVGGAESIDKEWRKSEAKSQNLKNAIWWEQEEFSLADLDWIKENVKVPIDIVISHTAPRMFFNHPTFRWYDKKEDQSCAYLDEIFNYFKPKKWYFGHWHEFMEGTVFQCEWMCLNMIYHKRCYRKLKLVK